MRRFASIPVLLLTLILLLAVPPIGVTQSPPFGGQSNMPGRGDSADPAGGQTIVAGIAAGQLPPGQPQMAQADEMIGFANQDGSGNQTITLVHTGKSWMSVYHVDRSGRIQLVGSRPIDADFSLQLNATDPLPETIRKMRDR
ncbi:MAG: hypothetical protein AAF958_07485 [Planctomycetota bacterium]